MPPDLRTHVLRDYDLDELFAYINPVMLYTRHLGYKGNFEEALEAGDAKARALRDSVAEVGEIMRAHPEIRAQAVYRFALANADGDRVLVYAPDGETVLETFRFGRQGAEPWLCLADFVLPVETGKRDSVCFLATTIGPGIRALAEDWKARGEYLKSHILQALALEGAEAFAELLHKKIREMWGTGDPPGTTRDDLFRARYRGIRVSFGYPACPRLEDQVKLFRLLDVTRNIGVRLTEGLMMDPEGSVTALVFHHPQARYFRLAPEDIDRLEREIQREAASRS